MKHESLLTFTYYTSLVVLTVAPAWRSFLTTLEWPLRDAIISAVEPYPVRRCGGRNVILVYTETSHTQRILSLVF